MCVQEAVCRDFSGLSTDWLNAVNNGTPIDIRTTCSQQGPVYKDAPHSAYITATMHTVGFEKM